MELSLLPLKRLGFPGLCCYGLDAFESLAARSSGWAAPFFMVALPVFAAMLIGDGGYGLLVTLVPLLLWPKMVRVMGRQTSQLVVIFGILTVFRVATVLPTARIWGSA